MARKTKIEGWRKIAAATWAHPYDPQIYGDLELDASAMLAFIDEVRASGKRLTVTHLVGKALGYALGQHPDLNVHLYRGNFIQRETVDIFFIVSVGQGSELSGVKVESADRKSAVEIADELAQRSGRIRSGDDVEFGKTKSMFARTPRRLLQLGFKVASWLTTDKDLDLKKHGLPRQPFGSAMVTSVGMFGIQHAYAPLSPYYRLPILLLVGEVVRKPVAIGEEVHIKPMITLSATLDHRYLDGYHAARLAGSAREYLENPKSFEPPLHTAT